MHAGRLRRNGSPTARGKHGGHTLPTSSAPPDLESAPVVLREELARLRARGRSFPQAWPIAVRRAVRGLAPGSAAWWVGVFAEQREVWSVNYSRAP
jgi:hypothetical protein